MASESITVSALVPAKLNLGLAIVGRRDDGFHELVTIMQTITLCDRLSLTGQCGDGTVARVALSSVTPANGVAVDDPGVIAEDNLAVLAVSRTLSALGAGGEYRVALEKGIPAASGMGGASADAAAAILTTERAANRQLSDGERLRIAAELGSDVPFFLTGGSALVTGRGEWVEPLPGIGHTSFVVVFPRLSTPIQRKTARLFAALTLDDFVEGAAVRRQATRITAGLPLEPALLGNGFGRALLAIAPELTELREIMADVTGQPVALSGAGPTHYVVEPESDRADWDVERLRTRLGAPALVVRCEPWAGTAEIASGGHGPSWSAS